MQRGLSIGRRQARAFVANALVVLLLLHAALAAVGATRAYGAGNDFAISAVLCSGAGLAGEAQHDDAGSTGRPAAYHCILCSLAQGGCGPALAPTTVVASAPGRAFVIVFFGRAQETRALRPSGWASSWSSRAPPLHA